MSDGCVYYEMWMFSYMLGSRFWHTIVAWLEAGISGDFPLDSLYNKYCERMLVFHKMIAQLMKDPGKRCIMQLTMDHGCSPICLVVASHMQLVVM